MLKAPPSDEYSVLESAAPRLKVLGDPARLKILLELARHPSCCGGGEGLCACDFEAITGLSQPTVSYHMKALTAAGLVTAEKQGKWMYYRIEPAGLLPVKEVLFLLKV